MLKSQIDSCSKAYVMYLYTWHTNCEQKNNRRCFSITPFCPNHAVDIILCIFQTGDYNLFKRLALWQRTVGTDNGIYGLPRVTSPFRIYPSISSGKSTLIGNPLSIFESSLFQLFRVSGNVKRLETITKAITVLYDEDTTMRSRTSIQNIEGQNTFQS